ncbi:MAG: tRNA (N(6)-L-threonylcarbamoyladenosine(37)-C(2))-methylthiotransferase MtaB, partial [Oscillospiraceae bacterium]|nr:tRNA (N(6)-L-threonylcarbamoyladenosine(37)-C(2))-methylthiotransferase MtaB [Oscillospiraceae bacterium]
YDTVRYLESVRLLNRYFDRPAVTTDLIVGFPGETEEEFLQTLEFIRKCAFAEMHIFPYSMRTGTPAAEMEQVEKCVKEERAVRAAETACEMHRKYLEGCVGQVFDVLFEQPVDGVFQGHAPNYMVAAVGQDNLHNQILPVKITGIRKDGVLLGVLKERQ